MASSTPTPADPTPAPAREPRQQVLATIAEQVAAIDGLVDIAEHMIRVFDDDLSQMGWNSPARTDRAVSASASGVKARVYRVVIIKNGKFVRRKQQDVSAARAALSAIVPGRPPFTDASWLWSWLAVCSCDIWLEVGWK